MAPFDISGRTAAVAARRIVLQARREQFVVLSPGQQWNITLDAPALRAPLMVAPGEYTAVATYVNYPDYDSLHYDPYVMPRDIWEGTVDAPRIQFAVLPPTLAEVDQQIGRMRSSGDDVSPVRWLAKSGREGLSALLRQFDAEPYGKTGFAILVAMREVDLLPIQELLAAIGKLPQGQRQSMLSSPELSIAVGDRVTCELLEFVVSQLDVFTSRPSPAVSRWFTQGREQCASIRVQLREVLISSTALPYARQNAAALLGAFRHPDDLALLTDILEQRFPTGFASSKYSDDAIRIGAVAGLSQFRGSQVVDVLSRAIAHEQNARIATELADGLFTVGSPEVVTPLIQVLSSSQVNLVLRAIIRLEGLNARRALPALIGLLRHPDPTVRAYAAGAVRRLGDDGAREAMLTMALDDRADAQSNALFYLAEHGDSSLHELFMTGMLSSNQFTREAAVRGLGRFGVADDFPRLRRMFELSRPDVRGYLPSALGALTFATHAYPSDATPPFWDTWYEQHRGSTRVEWAREALSRTDQGFRSWPFDASPQREALAFLLAQHTPRVMADLEYAVQTTRFAVRIEAARAMSTLDRRTAARLLVREFDSRFLSACTAANRALNTITGQNQSVDCSDPVARLQGVAVWQAIVN